MACHREEDQVNILTIGNNMLTIGNNMMTIGNNNYDDHR